MVYFSLSIQESKQVYNFKAKDVGLVFNEWPNHLRGYRHLLANRLHGKEAELCLARS